MLCINYFLRELNTALSPIAIIRAAGDPDGTADRNPAPAPRIVRRTGGGARAWLAAGLALAFTGLATETRAEELRIVMLGDSLTAGYGLASRDGLPARLETALRARGLDARVIDAGVSGDTTAGGLARLD